MYKKLIKKIFMAHFSKNNIQITWEKSNKFLSIYNFKQFY